MNEHVPPNGEANRVRPCVLVFVGCYVPGFRAGGPIQSIWNLVEALGEDLDFRIVTADRDLGQHSPYVGVVLNEWTPVGRGSVLYVRSGLRGSLRAWALVRKVPFDVIYLNSFFSPGFSFVPILMRKLGLLRRTPVIVAPRGEFASAALRRKRFKKSVYGTLVRWTGLFTDTIWHASSDAEAQDMRNAQRMQVGIMMVYPVGITAATARSHRMAPIISVAHNVVGSAGPPSDICDIPPKEPGRLNLVYVGRIHPHKQLSWALQVLASVRGNVRFDVVGPIEDGRYWQECLRLSAALPDGSSMQYIGEMPHDEVLEQLETHHALFLPSRSENYGHSIVEALSAGRPVIISDQTPWRQLQQSHAGWDVPVGDFVQWLAAVQGLTDCGQDEYAAYCQGARRYSQAHCGESAAVEENRKMFVLALAASGLGK